MGSEYVGVKYYSDNDLSLGWNLEKSEEIIQSIDFYKTDNNINYILELYNVHLLIKSDVRLTSWSDEYYNNIKIKSNGIMRVVAKYFNNIELDDISNFYDDISYLYLDNLWEIISKFKIYEKFNSYSFAEFLRNKRVNLEYILRHKNIVKKFDDKIKDYILSYEGSAELLISYHLKSKPSSYIKIYLPVSLSISEERNIIRDYVNSREANPNYLDLIYRARSGDNSIVTDKIRLEAKNKYEELVSIHISNKSGIKIGATVGFADIDDYMLIDTSNTFEPKLIYDRKWITENLDYPTILNNFIFLFEFTDSCFISSFPSKDYEISPLENLSIIKGERYYKKGLYFEFKESKSDLEIMAYYNELKNLNVSLEDVFKWFFENYLNEEFNATGFKLNIPTEKSSYIEKIKTICEQLDSILKQFTIFVNEGELNPDLVRITRNTPLLENIPSFNNKKYAYIKDSELKFIIHLLFSNQSPLAYNKDIKLDYNSFAELINLGSFTIDDFANYQKGYIKLLIEEEIIILEDRILRFNNNAFNLLNYYYYNDVICLTYYKNNKFLKKIMEDKKINIEGTLFSKSEVDYLNYILNDRSFDNGLSLRNKYLHGSYYAENEKENEIDYFKLLKIYALIIIKINEEFCRNNDTWNKSEE
ncbi:hypothetical protein [Anaerococcus rubeinfantis]|uniref:hypothetical protein n=1 Tax=Anaerococcus rubeinfantis TaxID=1720199 RepID=UPI00073EF4C0|nr:hypothetical protein [Anaerococcus rubeinfantis]